MNNDNNMNMTTDESLAFEAVKEIQGMKRDYKRFPDYATIHEVYNSLRHELPEGFEESILNALRSLYRRGLITHHSTVNGVPMFGIKE